MQERVLGALIIGAIALTGLIWGTVEGVAASIKVRNDEKELEKLTAEKINKEFSKYSSESFDLRMVRYRKIEDKSSKRETKIYLFVDLCGYTKDNKEFTYGIVTNKKEYVTLAINKKFDSIFTIESEWSEEERASKIEYNNNLTTRKMANDLAKNYTVTTPETISNLYEESDVVTYKFVLDNDVKYQVDYTQEKKEGTVTTNTVVDKR